jgi:hypothetical protein
MKFKMQIFLDREGSISNNKITLKLKNVILTHVSFIENYARLLLDC